MLTDVQFVFRKVLYSCEAFIDYTEEPCYIFCMLRNERLIQEFGDEVTIKTDCHKLLPKKDDYPALVELRQAIFSAVKNTREFMLVTATPPQNSKGSNYFGRLKQ